MTDLDPKVLNAMLEQDMADLMELETERILSPRVSRERAQELTLTVFTSFTPLVSSLELELSPPRAQQRLLEYNTLQDKALVYYAADLHSESPWTPEMKERKRHLSSQVRQHDLTLFTWAWPLWGKDQRIQPILVNIRSGSGLKDDADDTTRLVNIFRANWSQAEGRTAITSEYLDLAEAEATELIRLISAGDEDVEGSPADVRRRAYTRWSLAYNELVHLGRYLLRHDPDGASLFPGIYSERHATPSAPPAPPEATVTKIGQNFVPTT